MAENWTNAHTLMYFLFGFSHLTDWKVTEEEKEESIRIAEKYFDGVPGRILNSGISFYYERTNSKL